MKQQQLKNPLLPEVRFRRFRASGLSVARFCEEERVSVNTFYVEADLVARSRRPQWIELRLGNHPRCLQGHDLNANRLLLRTDEEAQVVAAEQVPAGMVPGRGQRRYGQKKHDRGSYVSSLAPEREPADQPRRLVPQEGQRGVKGQKSKVLVAVASHRWNLADRYPEYNSRPKDLLCRVRSRHGRRSPGDFHFMITIGTDARGSIRTY